METCIARKPFIIGIEGPVCAGKTTLLNSIGATFGNTLLMPEYYEMLGKRRFRDMSPKIGLAYQKHLISLFRECEICRKALVPADASDVRTVILDRTFFSVASWHYALHGGKQTLHLRELLKWINWHHCVMPDRIYYMDIPHARVLRRAQMVRFDQQSPALSPDFTRLTRQFFSIFVAPVLPVVFVPHHQLLATLKVEVAAIDRSEAAPKFL